MVKKYNSQKNIMWIASNAPYSGAPAAGGQTFNYYLNGFKRSADFNIRLVCWGDIWKKKEIEDEQKDIVHHVIYTEPTLKSKIKKISNIESSYNPWNKNANLISNYCANEIINTLVNWKVEGFLPDCIILEWTNTVVLASRIHKIFPDAKLIASEHDVTFVGYKRKAKYFKGIKKILWKHKYLYEKKTELNALRECDLILPHNAENKEVLIKYGVNEEKIQWLVPYYSNMSGCARKSNNRDILFFGAMSRPENYLSAIWFIENVMPLLNDLDVRFVIVGSKPPEELKRFKSDRIVITGFVNDTLPYFESSMCLVAPLVLGAGIKVKILEAMSSGIPVLTNNIGIEGIPAENGSTYFHCNDAETYNKIIRQLYSGEIDTETVSIKSREFMKRLFDVEGSLRRYMYLCKEL